MTVRVLIVDDQEPFRRAMGAVVEETDGFVVVGSATSGEEGAACPFPPASAWPQRPGMPMSESFPIVEGR